MNIKEKIIGFVSRTKGEIFKAKANVSISRKHSIGERPDVMANISQS